MAKSKEQIQAFVIGMFAAGYDHHTKCRDGKSQCDDTCTVQAMVTIDIFQSMEIDEDTMSANILRNMTRKTFELEGN